MKMIYLPVFAASVAACAACGQLPTEAANAQAKSQQAEQSKENFHATALVSCNVGSETISLVRQSRGSVSFGAETSSIISASKTLRENTLSYSIKTAAGNDIEIRLPYPVAGSGSVVVLDRGVIGGQCDAASIKINLKSLDTLVADARPQPRYLFADCTWYNHPGARLTVRKGLDQSTIIFEADLAEQGRGGETLAYVATGFTPGSGTGGEPDFIEFNGAGNISWSGLGRHAAAVASLRLTSSGEILLGEGEAFPPLVSCIVSNLDFVRRVLSR